MPTRRYPQLIEAEILLEDVGLAELIDQRDEGTDHEGTTAEFLAEVEQHGR